MQGSRRWKQPCCSLSVLPSRFTSPSATGNAPTLLESKGVRPKELRSDPFKTFVRRWAEWCVSPAGRDVHLVEEYDQTYGALQALMQRARATTPRARWKILRGVASGGILRLGALSYTIPPKFWELMPDWAISELTEGLLALRHYGMKQGLNRTAIKDRLRVQRLERDIGEAWARYGRWLDDAPETRRQVETLLGSLSPLRPA